MKKIFPVIGFFVVLTGMSSCAASVDFETISSIEPGLYMGTWYEIARLDFFFERNLDNTTAEYCLRGNGTISVTNSGYNYIKKKWVEARGTARFRTDRRDGSLEVSFFGPFYSQYNILVLDKDYRYALVAGKNLNYLWILSRHPEIPDSVKNDYLAFAKKQGFDTTKLIWVSHFSGD